MVSMKEVAELAGVSVATVSRALSGKENVREEVKEKIFHVIDELHYTPNMLGRNLRKSSTKMILALVPSVSNPFYSRIVRGIEDVLSKKSYYLLLRNTYSEEALYQKGIDLLRLRMADGLIWMDPTADISEIKKISLQFPLVCCSEIHSDHINSISIDNEEAIKEIYRHLLDQGYRRIALFGASPAYDYMRYRCKGYEAVAVESGVNYIKVVNTEFNKEKAQELFLQLYHSDSRPDAVIATSDVIAQYLLEVTERENIKVGTDFGLVGFDNIGFSSVTNPSLTTVQQPTYEIGEYAAKKVLDIIESKKEGGEATYKHMKMPHRLIIRNSSKKAS